MLSNILTTRYTIFVVTAVITVVINQIITQYDIDKQNNDNELIDIVGRQRMLSQRIAKLAQYLQEDFDKHKPVFKRRLDTLYKLADEFEKTHFMLLAESKELGLKGVTNTKLDILLNAHTRSLKRIVRACRQILPESPKANIDSAVAVIERHELKFMLAMDRVVRIYEAQERERNLLRIELVLTIITILILLLEFIFIFQPLIQNLRKSNQSMQQTNTQLQLISQDLKAILDSTQVAIVRTDANGIITHFNKGAERMLGYTAEELLYQYTPEVLLVAQEILDYGVEQSAELQKEVKGFEALVENIKQSNSESRQCTYVRKDGTTLQVQLVITGILSPEDNAIIGFIGVATDITEEVLSKSILIGTKEELEFTTEKLTKQNQKLRDFAHIASHNLRSPVSNLLGLLDIYKDNEDSDYQKMVFSKFEIVIHHLSSTLNDLIDSLKIQEDVNKEREIIVFEEVFNKVKEIFAGQLITTQAVIYTDFTKLPSINYPKAYLESILLNLFSNALKYHSPDKPPLIQIETDTHNEQQVLYIRDNGLGIDLEKHKHKIFGLNKTFHRHPESKGVGLFITKTQVEAMGGSMYVESKVGLGSVFTIIFNNKP
jgi:PAS domain S-box-containing protein